MKIKCKRKSCGKSFVVDTSVVRIEVHTPQEKLFVNCPGCEKRYYINNKQWTQLLNEERIMKRKRKWKNRLKVKACNYRIICKCPCCGQIHCDHWDNDDGDCGRESCPLFDGKRWREDKQ